jgi:hypothetical protein
MWSWCCLWSIYSGLEKKLVFFSEKYNSHSRNLGIRLLDGRITTLIEARSLALFANDTDIKSASWG